MSSYTDNRFSEDYHSSESDEYEEPEDALDRRLDLEMRKIKRAAFESCISDIEADDDDTLVKGIWGRILSFVRKPYVREAMIITALMLFKTGLFMTYRAAQKHGLEIVNL